MAIAKRTTQTKAAQTKTARTTSENLDQSLTFATAHSVKRASVSSIPPRTALPSTLHRQTDLDGPNVITSAAERPFIIRLLKKFYDPLPSF